MSDRIEDTLLKLEDYCSKYRYKGYDPYDGLNSAFFRAIPFISDSRILRLVWIQFFKRSFLNLRPLVGIKKEHNPKALGLFLSGYCNLSKIWKDRSFSDNISYLTEAIKTNINKNWSGACWGYNFDWQSRAFFLPKNTPTVVATSFISMGLLDAYELSGNKELLDIVRSSCDFIIKDLNKTFDKKGNFAFSYSPLDKSVVYNASLLGSRILSRVYGITRESELIINAEKSVSFCCNYQKPDGSWSYGSAIFHDWIDNFHTGFNLVAITNYIQHSGDERYSGNLWRGFEYYIETFFTEKGIPKYYNNSLYPVDIHSTAQLIITLFSLGKLEQYKELGLKVLNWTIDNMKSPRGYFYYQKNRVLTSKIPYMRWAQAWMFYSLSLFMSDSVKDYK